MPTLLIFSLGTLAWLAVLVFIGARHVLGYGADVRIAAIAGVGVLLGLGGMLWARLRGQREGTATGVPETTTASTAPVAAASHEPNGRKPTSSAPTSSKPVNSMPTSSQPTGSQPTSSAPTSSKPDPPEPQDQS